MKHPPPGMAAFTAEVIATTTTVLTAGEPHPPLDQLLDACRTLLDDKTDHVFPAEIGAAGEGVLDVGGEAVRFVLNGGNASLGVIGAGFEFFLLGDDGHRAEIRRFDRKTQAGDPAAQDEKIGLYLHF